MLAIVALTPAAPTLADVSSDLATPWPPALQPVLTLVIFVSVLAFAAAVVAFPVSVYARRRVARRLRPTAAESGSLLWAYGRDALVGTVFALALAVVVRVSLWIGGGGWWLLMSVWLALLSLVALRFVGAGLVASGETRPLGRPALAAHLTALSEQACRQAVDVRVWTPTSGGATAAVTGVGRTGHVLLSSEMVRDWADDEIAVVVAHELSHHARHDLGRRVAVDTGLWVATLGVTDRTVALIAPMVGVGSVADLAALPLLAVVAGVLWVVARPLRLAQSRAHERLADQFALELTGNPEAFTRAIRRLGEAHLAEERPSRWTRWFFHQHPTVEERLRLSARQQ